MVGGIPVASGFSRKNALQSDHSIISELTAWRSGRATGLFRERDTVVKVKARESDVSSVRPSRPTVALEA